MTPEQEVRAYALLSAATIVAPQLADIDEEVDVSEQFQQLVGMYADFIQHGHWPIPEVPEE